MNTIQTAVLVVVVLNKCFVFCGSLWFSGSAV